MAACAQPKSRAGDKHVAEQRVAHGAAGRASFEINIVRRGPVNGVVICPIMQPPIQFIAAFEAAGWSNTRHVAVHDAVPVDHPARELLASFGGLHVFPKSDSGIECGTSDVDFQFVDHRWHVIDEWEKLLAVRLCGVALASKTYEQIWLAADGRVFASNDVTDDFSFVGAEINDAIGNLLSGIRHRPLLLPGETRTMIYGETMLSGDPRIYEWHPPR